MRPGNRTYRQLPAYRSILPLRGLLKADSGEIVGVR